MFSFAVRYLPRLAAGCTIFSTLIIATATAETTCEAPLREIVQARDFQYAYYCAEIQFDANPRDADAILVMARAAQELGQMERADELAKKARTLNLSTGQKFAAYLISGMAQASQQNFTTAKVLLYRASDFARLEPETRVVRQALNRLNTDAPWRLSIDGNILPSSNINSGSLHETIELGSLEFGLDEDAQAQAGVGYTGSLAATHRKRISARAVWENSANLSATVYDGRARNTATYGVVSGLHYTPANTPSALIYTYLGFEKNFAADEIDGPVLGIYSPYYSQITAGLEYHLSRRNGSAWKIFATYVDRKSDISALQDTQITTAGLSYSHAINDNTVVGFSGFLQNSNSVSADIAANAQNLSAEISWRPDGSPLTLSGAVNYTHTDYIHQLFGYPEARIDDDVTLEAAFMHNDIQFYGFNPTFGVRLERDFSNLARYDTENLQVFTRLSTSF